MTAWDLPVVAHDRRKALFISTDHYSDSSFRRLRAPEADAAGLAAVLADPQIGSFSVERLHNATAAEVNVTLEGFFSDARLTDTLVLYVSGHGVKDMSGRLHFVVTDSRQGRLGSTAISSVFLHEQLIRSHSRRKCVILDCCYAGAFPFAGQERGGNRFEAGPVLTGRGTAILASSTSVEYAFEEVRDPSDIARQSMSVFTDSLVKGLASGDADLGGDGLIDVAELYEYVFAKVRGRSAGQTPTFSSRLEGKLVIAESRRGVRAPVGQPVDDPTGVSEPNDERDLRITRDSDGRLSASVGRRTILMGAASLTVRARAGHVGDPWIVQSVTGQGETGALDLAGHLAERWPDTQVFRRYADDALAFQVNFPGGKVFGGAAAEMRVYPSSGSCASGVYVSIPGSRSSVDFLWSTEQSCVVAACSDELGERFLALDKNAVRHQMRRQRDAGSVRVFIPAANEIDDLTYGVFWAVHNLDSALLEDDQRIWRSQRELAHFRSMATSAVSGEVVPDLNPVSRAWIGSDFCAQYITANLDADPRAPHFWTREQTGEEACLWLFVAHKVDYLRQTNRLSALDSEHSSTRTFCIPEDVMRFGKPHERTLLFLAVALMEAFDIHVQVSVDPRFAGVEGFVLVPESRALIANWVRSDGIWHVNSTTNARALPDFADPVDEAMRSGLSRHAHALPRLLALAEYLDLDWSWLRRRCGELAGAGPRNLIQPRSRLLTLEGLELACRFIAFGEKPRMT